MRPLGGRLVDRVGARLPFTVGSVILFASYWPLAHLNGDTHLGWIALALLGEVTGRAVLQRTPLGRSRSGIVGSSRRALAFTAAPAGRRLS